MNPAFATYECRYDSADLSGTCQRYDSLSNAETCPHIRKAEPNIGNIEFYAAMDSCCHKNQPDLEGVCDKEESSVLRFIAKTTFRNRSTRPRAVTVQLKSVRQDLLRFPDGQDDASSGTIILDRTEKPMWLYPIYMKAGGENHAADSVITEKLPEHDERYVPVEVDVDIWQDYPTRKSQKHRAILEVTIPPQSGDMPESNGGEDTPDISSADAGTDAQQPETASMNWDIFISHASEDKESFVRPLADELQQRGLRVWYDEFTLTLGDSLRRSIDRGLAQSRFGIVVLSLAFFEKEWPQRELDGLTAREINGGKVILPIWHDVTRADIVRYSPVLADRVGASTSRGLDSVVAEVMQAIEGQSSPTPPQ